jgi:hypothetical protein
MECWVEPLEWVLSELKKEPEKNCSNCYWDNSCQKELLKKQHWNYHKDLIELTYCSNYKTKE